MPRVGLTYCLRCRRFLPPEQVYNFAGHLRHGFLENITRNGKTQEVIRVCGFIFVV